METKLKIGLIAIMAVVSLPIIWISDPLVVDASSLYWSAEIGEEVNYRIVYSTINSHIPESNDTMAYWLEPLNNTEVTFDITYLPEIPQFMGADEFIESVINTTKSGVLFTNGSAIPTAYSRILNELFSRCLLPVGDWIYLDRLFLDSPSPSTVYELDYSYISSFDSGIFRIEHIGISQHGKEGWSGIVDLTNGFPSSVKQSSRWHFGFEPEYGYDFSLIMVNS